MKTIIKHKNLPNILTISRIMLIPLFILMVWYSTPVYRFIFLAIYIYASITDFLDGYLAREYNLQSTFGRIMDPIADKALILILCIVILLKDYNTAMLIFIPVIILLARELIISGIREGLANSNITIHVSKIGKYKTAMQMVSLGFLIAGGTENWFFIAVNAIGIALLLIAVVLSVWSGLQYITTFYKHI